MQQNTNYWGSINLDRIKEAIEKVPAKLKNDDKYGKQLQVDAKVWDDGNVSISVYNKDTKERVTVASLRVSNFQPDAKPADGLPLVASNPTPPASAKTESTDLPF